MRQNIYHRQKRKKRNRKIRRISVVLLIISLIIAGTFKGIDLFKKDVVEAIKVDKTLKMLEEDNPINLMMERKIKEVEESRAEEVIKEKRQKIEEERRQEELEKKRNKDSKVAYLTFDDGPSKKVTPMILDILNEYNIKATFFVVGNMVEENPEILKRTFKEGHQIGNHSYSHDYGFIYKNKENFLYDFNKSQKLLKNILGEDFNSRLIRFPGGSFGKHKEVMREAALGAGYKYIDWNALNGDAEGLNKTQEELINRVKETTYNKKDVIILMHDTDAKINTALSLRRVIEYLISENYYFDVLD